MLYFHDLSTVLNVSRCSRHYKKQKIKTHIHEMLIVVNVVSYVIFDDLQRRSLQSGKALVLSWQLFYESATPLKFKYSVAFDDLEYPPKPRRDQYGICYRGVI